MRQARNIVIGSHEGLPDFNSRIEQSQICGAETYRNGYVYCDGKKGHDGSHTITVWNVVHYSWEVAK